MQDQINALEERVKNLEAKNTQLSNDLYTLSDLFYRFVQADKYYFDYDVEVTGNFKLNKNVDISTNGTSIGTSATQKLAFYGKTPIVQQSAIAGPAGGATIDVQARSSISAIIAFLSTIGLTA